MDKKTQTISGIEIEVKANLAVDDKTFRTCLNLIDIYMQNHDVEGF